MRNREASSPWQRRSRWIKGTSQHLKVDSSSKLKGSWTARAEHLSYSALGLSKTRAYQTVAVTGQIRDIEHIEHFAHQGDPQSIPHLETIAQPKILGQ